MSLALVTGAGGLIGSAVSRYLIARDWEVMGVENNQRAKFFGAEGDTSATFSDLIDLPLFMPVQTDIRNDYGMDKLFRMNRFSLIVHCAAQPSHDWSASHPDVDFDINAVGTAKLLHLYRTHNPSAVFIFMSTNKVYGDNPNRANLVSSDLRCDLAAVQSIPGISADGVSESLSIDHCVHSPFGASKLAADILAQEYGKYYRLPVGVFRGGCLTGKQHASVELHGFLSYIVKCAVRNHPYTIFGYEGKQVRDQIHADDVASAFLSFWRNPRCGEAYNLGGGKDNSASILEIIAMLRERGFPLKAALSPQARIGDHVCYYTDLSKFKRDYPDWAISRSLGSIVDELIDHFKS